MPFDGTKSGVNVAAILELADFVENTPHQFDMGKWSHDCGSPSCIGGHAQAMLPKVCPLKRLDITNDQYWNLFYPDEETGAYETNQHQAAKVLRHLAATGDVDWDVAFK